MLTKSANDPSPQLHRSDTERRQTECPVKRIAPCSPRPRYPSRHRLGEGGSEARSTGSDRIGMVRRWPGARPTLTDKIACNRRYPIYSVGNKALGRSALIEYDPVTLPTETNSAPPHGLSEEIQTSSPDSPSGNPVQDCQGISPPSKFDSWRNHLLRNYPGDSRRRRLTNTGSNRDCGRRPFSQR